MAKHPQILKVVFLISFLAGIAGSLQAQVPYTNRDTLIAFPSELHIGLRFSSNINYFPFSTEFLLAESAFTTGIFGPYLRWDRPRSSVELGIQIVYKNPNPTGFNLPGVMEDFSDDQSVGLTALEVDFKVGPKFGWFHPRIGGILGYRLDHADFQPNATELDPVKRIYLHLPFGAAALFPTNFGSVGFGAYYQIGVTKVLDIDEDDIINLGSGPIGGSWRAINFEIVVTYKRG